MLPEEALACARIRVLAAAATKGHDFLNEVLVAEKAGLQCTLEDVASVARALQDASLGKWANCASQDEAAFPAWPLTPGATKCLLRRFRKKAVAGRQRLVEPAATKACAHEQAAKAWVTLCCLPSRRPSDPMRLGQISIQGLRFPRTAVSGHCHCLFPLLDHNHRGLSSPHHCRRCLPRLPGHVRSSLPTIAGRAACSLFFNTLCGW